MNRAEFQKLAARVRDLQDSNKKNIDILLASAEDAGIDAGGLRRFVSWKRKDQEKRAQQEAIDEQCRYLGGERDTPAELPIGCELAQALNHFRRGFTVRQVAAELHISAGKAGKLRQLSRLFDIDSDTTVHVHDDVDKLPPHDPETGEIDEGEEVETVLHTFSPPAEEPGIPPKHAAAVGAVLDAIAAGDDSLDVPPFLDRRQRATT